jgi:Holliday junction resolvase RusA-like endonuclease
MKNPKQAHIPELLAIQFTFEGEPIPAIRPRVTSRGTFTPLVYRQYKATMANALQQEYGLLVAIPAPGSKDRSQYLKNHRYRLEVTAYRSNNRPVDTDNIAKTVLDALQDGGILANDSQVDELVSKKKFDQLRPRIEILLEELP